MDKISLIKINKVVGYFYSTNKTKMVVIYLKGGPSLPDNGDSPLWKVAKKYKCSLLIPDYIGHARSYGTFNFRNCLETIKECEGFLSGSKAAMQTENGQMIKVSFRQIVLVGSSWGSSMVPFASKVTTRISKIGLIKPLTDWTTQGRTKYAEEDVNITNNFTKRGWENMYRGYKKSEWPKIFQGKSKQYNPIDNLELLSNKEVFISHGKQDESINWRKSYLFYKKLKEKYPKNKIYWKLLNGGHSSQINALGLDFILKRVNEH